MCSGHPDQCLLQNIDTWYHNHSGVGVSRSFVPRSSGVIQRLLKHYLHVHKMRESHGEFDCRRCMDYKAAQRRQKHNTTRPGDDRVMLDGAIHKQIQCSQQRSYQAAQRFANVLQNTTAIVTQDFTTIELGANVGATPLEKSEAKIRALVFVVETGDKHHHYRVFLCNGKQSESNDFFFVRAAWYHVLGLPGLSPPLPVDALLRSASVIDVWSDGASSQFKQRFTLMMFYELTHQLGIKFRVNFFAPMHGHTLADGCCSRLKRAANRLLLIAQGGRATGVSFSTVAPSIRAFKRYLNEHMRDTHVTLLGKIDRSESLRSRQRPLKGMKDYFSFTFGLLAGRDIITGSILSDQQECDQEWLIDGAALPSSARKRPRESESVEEESKCEKKR